jgi:hypothetical protein
MALDTWTLGLDFALSRDDASPSYSQRFSGDRYSATMISQDTPFNKPSTHLSYLCFSPYGSLLRNRGNGFGHLFQLLVKMRRDGFGTIIVPWHSARRNHTVKNKKYLCDEKDHVEYTLSYELKHSTPFSFLIHSPFAMVWDSKLNTFAVCFLSVRGRIAGDCDCEYSYSYRPPTTDHPALA